MANYDQLPFDFVIGTWEGGTDSWDAPFWTTQLTYRAISFNNPLAGEEPIVITGYGYSHSG